MAGLAGQGAMAPMDQERQMIDEIKNMLMQGVDPQELISQGIPEQLIALAIQELEQEIAQEQQATQQPVTPAGQQMAPAGLAAQGA